MRRLIAVALVLAFALVTTGAAQADEARTAGVVEGAGLADCSYEMFCLYEHGGYNGNSVASILVTDENISRMDEYGFNDVASSVYNNTVYDIRVYQDYNFRGEYLDVAPGESVDIVNDSWNDRISSLWVY
jgi:Peptidase inhibitor family I36